MAKRTLLIHPDTHHVPAERGHQDINGPSLIRVPDWVEAPLGRYYLYFANHGGKYIRMAYSDDLLGPYVVYEPGVLHIRDTLFQPKDPDQRARHIASPDVHIDHENRRLVMYYHGALVLDRAGRQIGAVATSADGLVFADTGVLHRDLKPYFRAFAWQGVTYGTHFCWLTRGPAWDGPFEGREHPLFPGCGSGPTRNHHCPRHTANLVRGNVLTVLYSRYADAPERIMSSTVELTDDWTEWEASPFQEVLAPREDFEGAGLPIEPSRGGESKGPVCQLRDPAIYQEDGRVWLLYSVAGEYGIAITELEEYRE